MILILEITDNCNFLLLLNKYYILFKDSVIAEWLRLLISGHMSKLIDVGSRPDIHLAFYSFQKPIHGQEIHRSVLDLSRVSPNMSS